MRHASMRNMRVPLGACRALEGRFSTTGSSLLLATRPFPPASSILIRCASGTAPKPTRPTTPTRTLTKQTAVQDAPPFDTSVNPPASTRPAHLDLPTREPDASAVGYYFRLGKAYVTFYKNGLKAVLANRRHLQAVLAKTPQQEKPSVFRPYQVPNSFTRADWVLLWRYRHDSARLPLFGLILMVFGEFTPFAVVLFKGAVPYTCRLPKQVGTVHEETEARRALAFQHLDHEHPYGALSPKLQRGTARTHVMRSLHLVGGFWDRIGFIPPVLWGPRGGMRMAFLEGDDKLLLKAGGVATLVPEEVKLACAERGLDVLGRKHEELRGLLGDWLRLVAAEDLEERRKRMTVLLLTRPEDWPKNRNFALPDWHL